MKWTKTSQLQLYYFQLHNTIQYFILRNQGDIIRTSSVGSSWNPFVTGSGVAYEQNGQRGQHQHQEGQGNGTHVIDTI